MPESACRCCSSPTHACPIYTQNTHLSHESLNYPPLPTQVLNTNVEQGPWSPSLPRGPTNSSPAIGTPRLAIKEIQSGSNGASGDWMRKPVRKGHRALTGMWKKKNPSNMFYLLPHFSTFWCLIPQFPYIIQPLPTPGALKESLSTYVPPLKCPQ